MFRSSAAERGSAGFTLIEALVALTIISISLSSIGSLIATTVRGSRSIEANLTRQHAARAILANLPDRGQLLPGTLSGDVAGHQWRVDISPFMNNAVSAQRTIWLPQLIVLRIQSSSGKWMQIETIRLRRRAGK